jgi:hypothetical protein
MSQDRIVRFNATCGIPSEADLKTFLTDFVGAAGTVERVTDRRTLISLVGLDTHPLEHLRPDWVSVKAFLGAQRLQRSFEIFRGCKGGGGWGEEPYIDVITRQADAFTEAVARGVAQGIAQWFGGSFEQP